ncbi:MAG: sigma-70 family RNA polymerase sigma factor [Sphingomonadales bacterium]|nr:sigma-70 family RNA polymerase sigma factor [Sphingomonadales bacterium]
MSNADIPGAKPKGGRVSDPALVSIIEKYDAALMRFLSRRLRNPADAAEAAQEVYLRLHRYKRQANVEKPEAFLFTIAANLLRDLHRQGVSRSANGHISIDLVEPEAQCSSPEQQVQSRQALEVFSAALTELNPNTRRAFVLHRFSDLTYKQIAAEMGVSVAMIEHHIMRALSHLRKRMRKVR